MTIYRTMDTHCVRSFCKHVLGNPAEYADVETVEPDCYKSRKLKQVLDMPLDTTCSDSSLRSPQNFDLI